MLAPPSARRRQSPEPCDTVPGGDGFTLSVPEGGVDQRRVVRPRAHAVVRAERHRVRLPVEQRGGVGHPVDRRRLAARHPATDPPEVGLGAEIDARDQVAPQSTQRRGSEGVGRRREVGGDVRRRRQHDIVDGDAALAGHDTPAVAVPSHALD
ncbi:hypothetical protein BRD13_06820, partial [Halobacteriales archaeon SW_5_70_135]